MCYSISKFALFGVIAVLFVLLGSPCRARPLPVDEDTTRRFNPRLVLLLTDTSEEAQLQRTQLFYDELKTKFYRYGITRQLYNLLFTKPSRPRVPQAKQQDDIEYFQQFEGKLIQELSIKKLPLFGPTVNDTTPKSTNWFKRAGNTIHIQTRDWVINKNLLFKEGERVNAEILYDNERLLRSLSYIRDARILITEVPDNPDAVAIEVVTQDFFPLSFRAGRAPFSSYTLGVQNNNIFGIGHRFTNEVLYRSGGTPAIGYEGTYMVENVKGSFVNASVSGSYTDVRRGGGFSLQRPFFTPDIRWAGGLDLQRMEQMSYVLHRDREKDTLVWHASDLIDGWIGHAIPLNSAKPHPRGRESVVLAARGLRINNHEVPGGELYDSDFFINRKLWLGSAGWVRRKYRRDAYIFGFGRTEDVPLGALVNVTGGIEEQEQLQYYGQINAAWGAYLQKLGYLDLRMAVGQYFGTDKEASRRVRYGSLNWISPLMPRGRYRFRQLLTVDYLYGDKRHSYEFVSVSSQEIRGLRGVDFRGTQRLNVSLETIAFSPVQLLGFRLAGFAFADYAVLNSVPALNLKGRSLQGYGLGLRVRNENLVFKTFQLRLAYYPGPGGGFNISVLGRPNSTFQDFLVGRPQTQPYR
ncbi:hypothetical protein [Cesiribacter sp. SM1]|uniref:hypothetical protein n=1 Tax=Cesiribacter sp. SM1 TaxID=2861196 RepID=UPI001CD40D78|nr:hypothetical protein [Cesiribacter sp. SM1]